MIPLESAPNFGRAPYEPPSLQIRKTFAVLQCLARVSGVAFWLPGWLFKEFEWVKVSKNLNPPIVVPYIIPSLGYGSYKGFKGAVQGHRGGAVKVL